MENANAQNASHVLPPPPSPGMQLSRLSSVLNGLEHGACAMRAQALQARQAFRSGNYSVDAVKVSKRIINDCMGRN